MSDAEEKARRVAEAKARVFTKLAEVRATVRPAPVPKPEDPGLAKRREARRLLRELYPPAPPSSLVLTLDEQLESLRAAAAARKAGDARPSNDLVREAADRVREARKPRER